MRRSYAGEAWCLGFDHRLEGIMAQCVLLLKKRTDGERPSHKVPVQRVLR
jgi:hypothetical protein